MIAMNRTLEAMQLIAEVIKNENLSLRELHHLNDVQALLSLLTKSGTYQVQLREIDMGHVVHTSIVGEFRSLEGATTCAENAFHETFDMYELDALGVHDYQGELSWRIENPVTHLQAVECEIKEVVTLIPIYNE